MRRRKPAVTNTEVAATDAERIVAMLIGEVQAQRALEAAVSQLHDVKALAMLGLDGAGIAGLAAARPQLPPLWWVAVIALAASVPFFLLTIVDRSAYVGVDVADAYSEYVDRSAREAGLRFLSELRGQVAQGKHGRIVKARALSAGLALFVLGSLFSATFLARISLVR